MPPVARPSLAHEIAFPFAWRFLQTFWQWVNFRPGPFVPDADRSPEWNRGAYLVRALVHCAECHTPRNIIGGLVYDMALAGTEDGPEGENIPNITPDRDTGIGAWEEDDLAFLLKTGILPDGDVVGSLMGQVVDHSTSRLSDADIGAIVVYLRALRPIPNRIGGARPE